MWRAGFLSLLLCIGCDDGAAVDPRSSDAAVDAGAGDMLRDGPLPDMAVVDMAPPGTLEENFGVEETEGDAQCDGLHPGNCLMPFPSDYFRTALENGHFGLRFGPQTLPAYGRGDEHLRSEALEHADGWGPATPIMLTLPGATLVGTGPIFDPQSGLADASPTVILDADTGERVAHWAEFDYLTLDEPDPVIVLRPAAPLARNRRYIVAIRDFVDVDGMPLPATPGFQALRDQTASTTIGIHARRDRFEAEIFAPLSTAGIERGTLQIAWDFTTATAANGTAHLLSMRDQMLQALGPLGPVLTISDTEMLDGDPDIHTIFTITAEIPSFITTEDERGLRRVRLDDAGMPVSEGVERIEVTVQVPHAAFDEAGVWTNPLGLMMYGHGLLGSKNEARGRYLRRMANQYGFVILATDMQGMAEVDVGVWLRNLLNDPTAFPWFCEKAMQGVVNQLGLLRGVKAGGLAAILDDAPINADDLMYYGNSQGGTIGTLMMALTPDVPRGVLGVPGCCYPILLQRNADFVGEYVALFDNIIPSRTDFSLLLGLLGTGFDRLDPWTFGPHIIDDPLPDTPRHDVLLHIAKEDPSVHNEVSFLLARAIGAPLLEPALRPVWGLPTVTYPTTGSGTVEYDFGIADDDSPLTPPVAEDNGTHGWLRATPQAQEQMMHFLRTGEITDTCEAPCIADRP